MKKTTRYFQTLFAILLSLYVAKAFAFVDPPTFAPIAPNSTQPIVVSVRSGVCNGLGFGIPGGRPLRIEYFPEAINIFSPGVIAFSGACNIPIQITQFNVPPRPAGVYQVRIWIMDDLAPPDLATVLVSEATLTVSQGTGTLTPVPLMGIGSSAVLIMLIFMGIVCVTSDKRLTLFSIFLFINAAAFA